VGRKGGAASGYVLRGGRSNEAITVKLCGMGKGSGGKV